MRQIRQGLERFWEATWIIKGPILAIVSSVILATVLSILLTLVLSIHPRISNEGWIATATAVYAFFSALMFFVLLIAAVVALHQLQSMTRSRRLELLESMATRWDSDLLRKARRLANLLGDSLGQKLMEYEKNDAEEYYILAALAGYFEELGILTKYDRDALQYVKDYFLEASVENYWKLFAPYVKQQCEPTLFENFRDLVARMRSTSSP